MKKITLTESELAKLIEKMVYQKLSQKNVNEQFEDDDMDDMEPKVERYPVDDFEFELDDSEVSDITNQKGRMRRFRGSIYVDELVPETDDKEYDRKLAMKILQNYASKLPTREHYIGGIGFKQSSMLEPYDNMDF